MKALVLLHRWLGIGFCLLFAMWFASGIVMHFVPFPSLDEAARFAGLPPIDLSQVLREPDEAAAASNKGQVRRVRLLQRADGQSTSRLAVQGLSRFTPAICRTHR